MGLIYKWYKKIERALAPIARKIGAVFIFVFFLGAIFGYLIQEPIFLIAPLFGLAVMWYDLDQGMLAFIFAILASLYLSGVVVF
ncbi:MAG TPA: hypothetical protein VJK05_04270 [archaeon]|nr:hypothetical protein [archaeon]